MLALSVGREGRPRSSPPPAGPAAAQPSEPQGRQAPALGNPWNPRLGTYFPARIPQGLRRPLQPPIAALLLQPSTAALYCSPLLIDCPANGQAESPVGQPTGGSDQLRRATS